LIVSYLDRRST